MDQVQKEARGRPIKVVMAKMGMDSHYRGAIMVARYLVDRGMEVAYVGNQLPEGIAEAALQEDADVVGLSSLSGNHLVMAPRVVNALKERGLEDVVVVLGGVVPDADKDELRRAGVAEVFGTGSNLEAIARYIERRVEERSAPI